MKYLILILFGVISLGTPQGIVLDIPQQMFRVDNMGRLQVLQNGSLNLYDPQGKLIRHHSEQLLGRITSIDRNSSLKLLAFYQDIPAFQILDNTLTPHSDIYDLNEEGLSNLIAVCLSTNNTFWGYDGVSFELIRFDDSYRIISRSGSTALIIGSVLDPVRMLEHEGRLYIADPVLGVCVFDQFGSYERSIPYKGVIDMDIESDELYLSNGKELKRVGLTKKVVSKTIALEKEISSFDIAGKKIYLGDRKKIRTEDLYSLFD